MVNQVTVRFSAYRPCRCGLFAPVIFVVILQLSESGTWNPHGSHRSFGFRFCSPPNGTFISSFLASGFSFVSHTLLLVTNTNTTQPLVPCHTSLSESLPVSVCLYESLVALGMLTVNPTGMTIIQSLPPSLDCKLRAGKGCDCLVPSVLCPVPAASLVHAMGWCCSTWRVWFCHQVSSYLGLLLPSGSPSSVGTYGDWFRSLGEPCSVISLRSERNTELWSTLTISENG